MFTFQNIEFTPSFFMSNRNKNKIATEVTYLFSKILNSTSYEYSNVEHV